MSEKEYAYVDFETFSAIDLTAVDTVRYAKHRSTSIHCLGFYLEPNGESKVIRGVYSKLDLESRTSTVRKLLTTLAEDESVIFVAHNAFFDRLIWKHIMHKRFGYPDIPLERWKCTMAKCYKHGLPGSLFKAAAALELESQKDMVGQQNMLALAKPLKKPVYSCGLHQAPVTTPCCDNAKKFEFHTPAHFPSLFAKLHHYCITDVMCMVELDRFLPDLSNQQCKIWRIEQKINERGLLIDFELVEKAVSLIDLYRQEELGEYKKITKGTHKPTQRKELLKWLNDEKNVGVINTKKQTLQPLLLGGRVACDIKRAIELVLSTNKSSLAKYIKMFELCDGAHVVYSLIQYHAAHTMRFGGRGIQPQNLPRPTIKNIDLVLWLMRKGDYELFKIFYGDQLAEALSSALRAMLLARPGCKFLIGDYKQIEARLTSYFANQKWKLDLFRTGVDTYCRAAEPIYGYSVDPTMTQERQTGKACELGLGFGGGIAALVRTAKENGVDLSKVARGIINSATPKEINDSQYCIELYYRNNIEDPVDRDTALAAEIIKRRWRDANPEIVALWDDLEAQSTNALLEPGKVFYSAGGKLKWQLRGCFLFLTLPNGAYITYFKPKVHYDDRNEPYWSYATSDPKEPRKYVYGGYLTENAIQFAAASIMCNAMVRLDKHGYTVALTVHDEIISEEPLDADLDEFTNLMEVIPPGFEGLPLEVDSKEAMRYGK